MKKVKFRAWVYPNSAYKNGLMVNVQKMHFMNDGVSYIIDDKGRTFESDDIELLQYINFDDMNGVEVYEGDIVEVKYDSGMIRNYVVVFEKNEYCFKLTNGKTEYGNDFEYLSCCDEILVIGNYFENHNLIENEDCLL